MFSLIYRLQPIARPIPQAYSLQTLSKRPLSLFHRPPPSLVPTRSRQTVTYLTRHAHTELRGSTPSKLLFVGGIGRKTTEDDLRNIFAEFGEINKITIARFATGTPRCFGYVEYQSEQSAIAARERHRATPFVINTDTGNITVDYAIPQIKPRGSEVRPSSRLYIGGLHSTVTVKKVKEMFAEFEPVKARIWRTRRGPRGMLLISLGCGWVEFANVEVATAVLQRHATQPFSVRERNVDMGYFMVEEESVEEL